VDDDVIAFTTTLADLMGQALHRAAQYERHAHTAQVLQRSLLPTLPAVHDGLELAAVYAPADSGAQVGGDWYDVIDLGEGRAYLVIGDVMGHDIRAAAVMGQLRVALQVYAGIGYSPGEVLRQLHRLVDGLGDIELVTCLCAVYDARRQELTVANAGHLPPMIAAPGHRVAALSAPADPPLGAGSDTYRDHRHPVPPGSLLILHTDGLVERRSDSIDVGLARLAGFLDAEIDIGIDAGMPAGAGAGSGTPLARLAQATVDHMAGYTAAEDDAALLLVRTAAG
jgi:serine phosphatase RsbU (regulator of sigma subunit)